MHEQFGEWYRIANLQPEHELLERRWSGITSFASTCSEADVLDLARLFNNLPVRRDDFLGRFRAEFQEADAAFQMKGNDFELAVLAGASLSELSRSSEPKGQGVLSALAIVSPSLQRTRHCCAVPEIADEARTRLQRWSQLLRQRPSGKRVPTMIVSDARKELEEKLVSNQAPQYSPPLLKLLDSITARVKQIASRTNEIEQRQLLYHEDSDILWWVTAMHSRDLACPLSKLPLGAAAVVCGKELGDLTHVIPGPLAARAVLTRAVSTLSGQAGAQVSIAECVNATDRQWRKRWLDSFATEFPWDLCPLLCAVAKSVETEGEREWYAGYESSAKLGAKTAVSVVDVAVQVYEESLLGRVVGQQGEPH